MTQQYDYFVQNRDIRRCRKRVEQDHRTKKHYIDTVNSKIFEPRWMRYCGFQFWSTIIFQKQNLICAFRYVIAPNARVGGPSEGSVSYRVSCCTFDCFSECLCHHKENTVLRKNDVVGFGFVHRKIFRSHGTAVLV